MDHKRIEQLHEFYKKYLFEKCMPFWLKNSLDHEYGGYLTCLDRKGEVYNTDKSVWFQGRGTWLYSRLCNVAGFKDDWYMAAKSGYEFLSRYCFDTDGRMFFSVTQDGRPLQKRRYMFSETFAVMACAEYSRTSGDKGSLEKALEIYDMIMELYLNPSKLTPKINPETRSVKSLALPMILLNTTQTLREIYNNTKFDEIARKLVETILSEFYKPAEKALFETVSLNGERLDSPQGRCINPGHSIEAAWFIMKEGIHRNEKTLIDKALEILDCSLELGWDKEYGGLLYFVDIEGKPAEQLEWDMKLWWPHTEALYALLLAHHITGNGKYETWYERVHEWSFSSFEDKTYGEWFGYLHRDGTVSNTLKGSMWKGPFHLPRALLLNLKLLEEMQVEATKMTGGIANEF